MGTIAVHEFITLDGVIENPAWSFDWANTTVLDPYLHLTYSPVST